MPNPTNVDTPATEDSPPSASPLIQSPAQEQPDYSDLTAVLKEIAQGLSDVADAIRASDGMGKAIDATLHEWDAF